MFMSVPWFASWAKILLLSSDDISDYRHLPSFPVMLRVKRGPYIWAYWWEQTDLKMDQEIQASSQPTRAQGGPAGTSDKWFRGCRQAVQDPAAVESSTSECTPCSWSSSVIGKGRWTGDQQSTQLPDCHMFPDAVMISLQGRAAEDNATQVNVGEWAFSKDRGPDSACRLCVLKASPHPSSIRMEHSLVEESRMLREAGKALWFSAWESDPPGWGMKQSLEWGSCLMDGGNEKKKSISGALSSLERMVSEEMINNFLILEIC